MSWIDDDKAELLRLQQSASELEARECEIAAHAASIFTEVWSEIIAKLKEAEANGLGGILTNGSYWERKLIVPRRPIPPATGANPDEYIIRLSDNKQKILVTGPQINVVLPLELGTDGVTRVHHEGELKTAEDVAKLILRPLLFPDLYGPR